MGRRPIWNLPAILDPSVVRGDNTVTHVTNKMIFPLKFKHYFHTWTCWAGHGNLIHETYTTFLVIFCSNIYGYIYIYIVLYVLYIYTQYTYILILYIGLSRIQLKALISNISKIKHHPFISITACPRNLAHFLHRELLYIIEHDFLINDC